MNSEITTRWITVIR